MQWRALDEAALTDLAVRLGRCLQRGDIVLLEGGLGVGKTTFTRALARGLGVHRPDRVCSPTFNLCLVHEGPIPLVHVDLYRLADAGPQQAGAAAFEALGLQEVVEMLEASEPSTDTGVLIVEWSDLWAATPIDSLRIALRRTAGGQAREVDVLAGGARSNRLLACWEASTAGR